MGRGSAPPGGSWAPTPQTRHFPAKFRAAGWRKEAGSVHSHFIGSFQNINPAPPSLGGADRKSQILHTDVQKHACAKYPAEDLILIRGAASNTARLVWDAPVTCSDVR